MKTIQILGPGCRRCTTLAVNVQAAVKEMGLDARVEKVSDLATIAQMGVLTTPGLAIDGKVKVTGRLLSITQVKKLLEEMD